MNVDRFIGLPWLHLGRTPAGVDCWGLVRLVYAGELGIELPEHADHGGERHAISAIVESDRVEWIPVMTAARAGDVVLLRQAPWHVGVVVGRGRMLHIPEGRESCIEPYDTGRWGSRVEGVYRHISMIERAA